MSISFFFFPLLVYSLLSSFQTYTVHVLSFLDPCRFPPLQNSPYCWFSGVSKGLKINTFSRNQSVILETALLLPLLSASLFSPYSSPFLCVVIFLIFFPYVVIFPLVSETIMFPRVSDFQFFAFSETSLYFIYLIYIDEFETGVLTEVSSPGSEQGL